MDPATPRRMCFPEKMDILGHYTSKNKIRERSLPGHYMFVMLKRILVEEISFVDMKHAGNSAGRHVCD